MLEVYVLVPVRKSFLTVFLGVLSLVLGIFSLLLSCMSMVFLSLVVVFGGLWYFFTFCMSKEYEYSYFDGEVRFARVMNKSRRKSLGCISMENVIQIAPEGDRSVSPYENDKTIKVKDYSSRRKGALCYEMIFQKNSDTRLIKFEPDDKYLDAVEKKYAQKLVRRKPVEGSEDSSGIK